MADIDISELNILLIEPSSMQRKVIRHQLEEAQVYAVDTAQNSAEALDSIHRIRPDLIISALHYPDGSADQLLKTIRANPDYAEIPFMLISSETRRKELEIFKQSGVVAILPKPFSLANLKMALRSTLDFLCTEELDLELYDIARIEVLVVDDSGFARRHIMRVLKNLGIEHMTEAADGSEAIELLNEKAFDLIVTDYNMPEVNGAELAEFVRADSRLNHIPILMVTSEAQDAHLKNISHSGVNAMADKPFEPDTVKQLLLQILSSK